MTLVLLLGGSAAGWYLHTAPRPTRRNPVFGPAAGAKAECLPESPAENCYAALFAAGHGGDDYGFTSDSWPILVRYHEAIERTPPGPERWKNRFRLAKVMLDHLLLSLLSPQPEAVAAIARILEEPEPAGTAREKVQVLATRAAALLAREAAECPDEEHRAYLGIGSDLFAGLAAWAADGRLPATPRVREAACTTLSWRAGSRLLLLVALDEAIRTAPADDAAAVEKHFTERLGAQLGGVCPASGAEQLVLRPLVAFDAPALMAAGIRWTSALPAPAAVRAFALASELRDWDRHGLADHPLRGTVVARLPTWSASWTRSFPLPDGRRVRWDGSRGIVE